MTKLSTVLNTSVAIGSVPPMGVYVDMEEMTQHNQSRSTISDRITGEICSRFVILKSN
jgi:hypothetical protein